MLNYAAKLYELDYDQYKNAISSTIDVLRKVNYSNYTLLQTVISEIEFEYCALCDTDLFAGIDCDKFYDDLANEFSVESSLLDSFINDYEIHQVNTTSYSLVELIEKESFVLFVKAKEKLVFYRDKVNEYGITAIALSA